MALEPEIAPPAGPTGAERFALRVMEVGAIAVVLVASTLTAFELDRFFVPKELVLHLTAVLAGLLAFRSITRSSFTRVDLFLVACLTLSALSAMMATNKWLALRALAISTSGVVIFWVARALRNAGLADSLLNTLALAVVLTAMTSLLQTYGVETILFSESRAPGGTLGNRNFVAHVAAFGLPVCLLVALRAKRFFITSIGVAIVTASLVLTRSRAAWLAFGAVVLVFFVAMLRSDGRTWRRLAGILVMSGCAVTAALIIPNTLHWRSRNPYLESVTRVAEYQEGSGRGRLLQYERSLLMAARHPLFGAGPGNWAVEYPAHVPPNDPSLNDSEAGMTFNPWPSSDWIAFIAERGPLAAILIALAFIGIATRGLKQLASATDAEQALLATALLGTIAGAIVSGLFDAVLLIAVPAFLVWAALGALWRTDPGGRSMRWIIVVAVIVIAAAGAARSAAQLVAMDIYSMRGDRASLARAAQIDPGNYRLQLRLARAGPQRCEHARAAHALYPSAGAARDLSRHCGRD
ncbi:MAG TPA: O-antigen ligase family protein [Thermoanaerobaculia bacterium]